MYQYLDLIVRSPLELWLRWCQIIPVRGTTVNELLRDQDMLDIQEQFAKPVGGNIQHLKESTGSLITRSSARRLCSGIASSAQATVVQAPVRMALVMISPVLLHARLILFCKSSL